MARFIHEADHPYKTYHLRNFAELPAEEAIVLDISLKPRLEFHAIAAAQTVHHEVYIKSIPRVQISHDIVDDQFVTSSIVPSVTFSHSHVNSVMKIAMTAGTATLS